MANRRHWIIINKGDYDTADTIMASFYEQGDIDSVRVDESRGEGEIMLGIQCGWDDLVRLQYAFLQQGVVST